AGLGNPVLPGESRLFAERCRFYCSQFRLLVFQKSLFCISVCATVVSTGFFTRCRGGRFKECVREGILREEIRSRTASPRACSECVSCFRIFRRARSGCRCNGRDSRHLCI